MGIWNKIGKIALTAAPYVAAPFTGGLSLMATGAANKAVQKWSEADAKKQLAKGLAPSNFDRRLGQVGGYAALGSMFIPGGALGALGGASKAASTGANLVGTASKVGNTSKFLTGLTGGGASGWAGLAGAGSNIAGMSAMDKIGSGNTNEYSSPEYTSSLSPVGLGPSSPPAYNPVMAGREAARKRMAL